jgi:hypothetical protein
LIDIEKDDIGVYDLFGKKVAGRSTITIEKTSASSGYLVWNCSGIPTRIYLIYIQHGSMKKSIKVIVGSID